MINRHSVQVTLCFCLIAGGACRRQAAEEVETTTAVTVTTTTAEQGTIRGSVHATGIVTPGPDAELIVVAPEAAARVAEIPHASGDRVQRGDLLVRFEIPASAAEVQKQEAEVARAEAGLENVKAAQTRARDLFDKGVAARKEAEDATRALADAEAALAQAKAALNAARTVERRATVRATFDGVIARRSHNPGDLVEATASDPILRVVDPTRLEIVVAVPLSDAPRVQLGASARIATAPTDVSDVELTVKSRPTAVDPGTATVPVRLGFARAISIPIGTPVQVDISADEHRDVVIVPAAAVVHEGDEVAVFVVSEGMAHRRAVQTGTTDVTRVEILSGIAAGDRVIVDGQTGLPDGAAVVETTEPDRVTPASTKGGAQ